MDLFNANGARNCLPALQKLLGLTCSSHSDLQDFVFIAIDLENSAGITRGGSLKNANSQIGFAVLDMKNFLASPKKDISTFNITIGDLKYSKRVSGRFLFGEPFNLTTKRAISRKINDLVPKSRKIILVGHDITSDLRALASFNPEFKNYRVFDTQQIAHSVLSLDQQPKQNHTLRYLLTYFECPFNKLHCAGNDANFTLRLLLLLAIYPLRIASAQSVRSEAVLDDKSVFPYQKKVFTKLQEISRSPLPVKPQLHEIELARKKRRQERKRQARFQDAETIERVRAERARKKEMAAKYAPVKACR
ncbi:hypothetical protein TWF718_011041 [Orbilia javanica]|uniref:Gfd2/YDR514C-like C-terminal domain-containing protein n=1 Tax=Orbilia javanica TaxID=47235 RepID=A0AAN8MKV9_9PEZI